MTKNIKIVINVIYIFLKARGISYHQKMKKNKMFFKYCTKCDKKFQPDGKAQKLCSECQLKVRKESNLKHNKKNKK